MKLLDVEVRDYRKLRGPVKVSFSDGLNVIWGDNELGKSTLLDAIWDGLTLRSKIGGEARRRRQPFDGGNPMVTLRFSHGGSVYHLHKNFKGQGGLTTLSIDGGEVLFGAEAEAAVLRILGVVGAKRGDRLEREGIWPVVFVRQGKATEGPTADLDAAASGTLTQRLGDIAGEVFAGDGAETMLLRAGKERARYWTAKTGAATGELATERNKLRAAEAAHETAQERLRTYRQDIDEHAAAATQLRLAEAERPALDEALTEAQAAHTNLQQLRGRIEQAAGRRAVALAAADRARDHKRRRLELQMTLGRNRDAAAKLKRKVVIDETVLVRRARERDGFAEQVDAATDRWQQARAAEATARRRVRRHDAQLRVAQLDEQWAVIEAARRARDDARDAVVANPLTDERLHKLRSLGRARDEAVARLDAAAARVGIEALAAFDGTIGDEEFALEAGATRDVTVLQPTWIQLGQTARLHVRPGGEELPQRRQEAEEAAKALVDALRAVGCEDLVGAETKGDARRKGLAVQRAQQATLDALRPDRVEAARSAARDELDLLTVDDGEDETNDAAAWREIADRRGDDTAARAVEREEAKATLTAHDVKTAEISGATQQRKATLDGHIQREQKARTEHTEHLALHGDDAALETAHEQAQADAATAKEELTNLQRDLDALDPAAIEQAAATARAAVDVNRAAQTRAKTAISVLERRLDDAALVDLHGSVERAAAALARATKTTHRVERRAAAAKLLYDTLAAARADAQERHRRPLNDTLNELVGELFPGSKLTLLGENYDRPVLDRGPEGTFTFDQLSTGTREQIGMLVRIALARLLSKGIEMPLLLDDALVHTDPGRLRRIAEVLNLAARDLQVIYVTCDWPRLAPLMPSAHAVDFGAAAGRPDQPPMPRQESPAYP